MSQNPPSTGQPPEGANAPLRIEVHAGPLAGKGFPFKGNAVTFGRAPDNDLSLDDVQVSRHHAILRRQGELLILEDLGSTNGTKVNGERIHGPHMLQPTETISIGSSVFGVTGFAAPSTVGMSAHAGSAVAEPQWHTYQSSADYPPQNGSGASNWLLWSGLIILFLLVLTIIAGAIFVFTSNRGLTINNAPVVVISSPVNGSRFVVGQQVIIQTTATDASGVTSLQLWVAGEKVTEAKSPVASGQSPFTAVMSWIPQAPGAYSLEVRAFNSAGLESAPTTVNIEVEGLPATETPETPSPTPTVNGTPIGVVRTDLNVRNGPGTQYDVIGRLSPGIEVEIVGKNDIGTWWYIIYPASPDGRGWVASEYVPANNLDNIVIIPTPTSPPTSTPTPTGTPEPTATPTETPSPVPTVTDTPLPTNTPVPAEPTPTETPTPQATINFSADPVEILEGACTTFSWFVSGVQAVYFENEGVPGENENGGPVTKQECPTETRTYTLRVTKQDNSEESRQITIIVNKKPTAPTDLNITGFFVDGFNIIWIDNSSSETGFRAYNADTNERLATFERDTISGRISGLDCNKAYRIFLVAYNAVGESSPSNIVVDQTAACP